MAPEMKTFVRIRPHNFGRVISAQKSMRKVGCFGLENSRETTRQNK